MRTLTAGDRAVIAEFLLSDPAHTRICFDRDPVAEDADDLLSSAAYGPGPHAHALVGAFDEGGTLVGLLDWVARWPTPASGYVGLLQVRPGRRGAGIGTALLAHAQDAARAQGCRQLMLSVIARHREARTFWCRQGFQLLSAHRERTAGPLEAVVMHRPIPARGPEEHHGLDATLSA